jgi:methylglutaconyl-CoA hydratase
MDYTTIQIEKDQDVATIYLNRPDVHNAMDETLMRELTDCFTKLDNDIDIRIIILTGNGKSFCAGADLKWMKSMVHYSKEENIRDSRLLLDLYESIYHCDKPTIARVNGHAFGGGIGLFAACDIVVAVPECKFAFSEAKLGIIPSVISTYILRRAHSLSQVRRLFITGERFSSEYGEKIGLIDYVVNFEEIDTFIQKYITIIQSSGPKAITEVKGLLYAYETHPKEKYKEYTVNKISELRVSEEGQEGINAFLEKRKARWCE